MTESPYHQEAQISDWVIANTHQFIALNKPGGLPSQPDKTGNFSLHNLAEIYAQRQLYLIHRLDRPASGLVLFGKRPAVATELSAQFQAGTVRKQYLAIVGNLPDKPQNTLIHYVKRDGYRRRAELHDEPVADARKAELRYEVLASTERYHLLRVHLITGRFHQVRVQLAHIGCPVRGDVKYGARRSKKDRTIDLHAWKLDFEHPISGKPEYLTAPPPSENLWDDLCAMAFN